MSLKEWYSKFGKRPLVLFVLSILLIQLFYIFLVLSENHQKYRSSVDSMIKVIQVALLQKNRIMLEALVHNAADNVLLSGIGICKNNTAIMSFPANLEICGLNDKNFFKMSDTQIIPGFQEYKLIIQSPLIKLNFPIVLTFLLTSLVSGIAIILIRRLDRRFETELVTPISTDFDSLESMKIVEFEQMKARRERLIALEKQKATSDLARQVAHDIRSPISALRMFVQRKAESLPQSELTLIKQVSERILTIADDLLEKSRSYHIPHSTIGEIVKHTKQAIDEKNISEPDYIFELEIKNTIDETTPVSIDKDEWCRMISNLLTNAVEASTPSQPIILTLEIDASSIRMNCKDHGRGIPSEVLSKLRTEGGSFGKPSGNGLGLKQVRDLASTLHGKWAIESKEQVGTTVSLTVPTH